MWEGEYRGGEGHLGTSEAFENLSYLLRSENRVAVLEALHRSSWHRRELQEAIGVSRPTLARILVDFDARGWVERDGPEYTATSVGSLLAEQLADAMCGFGIVGRLEGLLEDVPADVVPSDPRILADARVTVADPSDPFGPIRRFSKLFGASETFRECNSTALEGVCEGSLDELLADGGTATVVYHPDAVESLFEDADLSLVKAVRDRRLRVLVHDSLSFGLSLFDERVALAGYDGSTGALSTLVDTDAPKARQWSERIFETYRSEAVPMSENDLPVTMEPNGSLL